MIMGDTDLVPFDAGTFGSRTNTADGDPSCGKAAATARQSLLDMAAKNWNDYSGG
jgi:isoquinoline 1-oxidoreductase